MAVISRVTTWSDGQILSASALNGEFNNILNDYNGGITNANISGSAAIAQSKLATLAVTESLISLSDNTTDDVSTSKHGFVPKAPNDTTKYLRGDGTWAVTAFNSGVSVTMSNVLNLPSGRTATKAPFDTKVYDIGTEFNTSTNTFTAINAGYYLVVFSGSMVSLSDTKLVDYMIYKNGAEALRNTFQAAGGVDLVGHVTGVLQLAVNDTISFYASQNDTVIQGLDKLVNRTFAMIQRLA